MVRKIFYRVLGRQDLGHDIVGFFSHGTLSARVFERRMLDGTVEYWIDVRWDSEGQEGTSYGLLRRTKPDLHFDAMREAQSYLRLLPR